MGLLRGHGPGEGMHFRGPNVHIDVIIDKIVGWGLIKEAIYFSVYHLDQKGGPSKFHVTPEHHQAALDHGILVAMNLRSRITGNKASMYYEAPQELSMQRLEFPNPPIRFYHPESRYGAFSNFSQHPVTIDDAVWPTAEHFFQSRKFATTNPDYAGCIRNAKTPELVFAMGRNRRKRMRRDWDQVRDNAMRLAVASKFVQHDDLSGMLLGTGDSVIIEATDHDRYWGEGNDGEGKNMLGQILMEVRGALRDGTIESCLTASYEHFTAAC